jgi:hypothetical protein
MIRMKKEYCALCNGTGFYDAPVESGGYKSTKCDHEWEDDALKYRLKKAHAKYDEAREEYLYLIKCKTHMEKV